MLQTQRANLKTLTGKGIISGIGMSQEDLKGSRRPISNNSLINRKLELRITV